MESNGSSWWSQYGSEVGLKRGNGVNILISDEPVV